MKRKILACVLACATLFLGMGYAYWTDSLQIKTTATTGELEVKFVDLALYGQYAGADKEIGWAVVDGIAPNGYTDTWYFDRNDDPGEHENYNIIASAGDLALYSARTWGYTKTTFGAVLVDAQPIDVTIDGYNPRNTNGSSTISIDLNKMYPGFAQVYQADIINTGTIAAKLADINFLVTEAANPQTKDMIGISMSVLQEYAGTPDQPHKDVFNTESIPAASKFKLAGVEFVRLSALEAAMNGDQDYINDLIYVLPDNCRMDLYLGIAMDPDKVGNYTSGSTELLSGKDDAVTENRTVKFNMNFLFDQFNIDKPTGGSNGHLDPASN